MPRGNGTLMKPALRSGINRATRRAQVRLALGLVAPLLLLVLVFFLFPLGNAIYYSLLDYNGVDPAPPFVGLSNYVELFNDPALWPAFRNNIVWIVVGTAAPIIVGLGLALLTWNIRRGTTAYRIALFLPYVLPTVVIGVVWGWIYDPMRGWLNQMLRAIGLDSLARGWLGDPDTALMAVLGTAIWATTGFVYVVLLSALRNVDAELLDAARMDGTNSAQRVWYIVLPQIMPVFLMLVTLTLVGGLSVFDIVFVMTGGGPANASEVLGTYSYSNAFQLGRVSYGTALALVITVLAVPIALFMNRLQRRLSNQGMGS